MTSKEEFKHYSKEIQSSIINGKISTRTTIVKIDTDSNGHLYGTLTIKIKDTADDKEHYETYKLSKGQIDTFRKFKITPTFEKLSNLSETIPRTRVKRKKTWRQNNSRKNRRNLTRRG